MVWALFGQQQRSPPLVENVPSFEKRSLQEQCVLYVETVLSWKPEIRFLLLLLLLMLLLLLLFETLQKSCCQRLIALLQPETLVASFIMVGDHYRHGCCPPPCSHLDGNNKGKFVKEPEQGFSIQANTQQRPSRWKSAANNRRGRRNDDGERRQAGRM